MRGRRIVVLALVAPLALGAVALAPASSAAGSFSSPTPADGAVLGSNSFSVQASITARSDSATLTVTGQDGSGSRLCSVSTSSRGGPVSDSATLTLSFPSSACNTIRNAQWTATLSGGASGRRTFWTNAAPSAPGNFSAEGSGARDVTFAWNRSYEPDLVGYTLLDGSGNTLDGDIGLGRCNGDTCSYGYFYESDNPGTHSYSLVSRRKSAGCGNCGSEVRSAKASDTATLSEPPPPPPPSPTPTPTPTDGSTGGSSGGDTSGGSTTGGSTTGGSTSGGSTSGGSTSGGSTSGGSTSGGSTSGGSTTAGGTTGGKTGSGVQPAAKPTLPSLPSRLAAARRAFALNFNAFAPSLGIPKLPPLPAAFPPTLSPELPEPSGTFAPTLPYKPPTETVENTSVAYGLRDGVNVTKVEELVPAIATALILLLLAAHLRRFLGAREEL